MVLQIDPIIYREISFTILKALPPSWVTTSLPKWNGPFMVTMGYQGQCYCRCHEPNVSFLLSHKGKWAFRAYNGGFLGCPASWLYCTSQQLPQSSSANWEVYHPGLVHGKVSLLFFSGLKMDHCGKMTPSGIVLWDSHGRNPLNDSKSDGQSVLQ